jgi:hypothetical protein
MRKRSPRATSMRWGPSTPTPKPATGLVAHAESMIAAANGQIIAVRLDGTAGAPLR